MSSTDKPNILIIDDSLMICRQIQVILAQEDLDIREAHSGEEAIQELERSQPDLILLDVVLPDIEGYELCREIMVRSDAVVVFITSRDSDKDVVKGFSLGACDYIKKPFRNEELKSRVMAHLQMKKQKDEMDRVNRELQKNMERLNYIAFRDGLTGLYNRHYVKDDLMADLKPRKQPWKDVGNIVMMADVDDFKIVNDQYGHDTGDMVLVCISNIMEDICRRHKVIRWGGEEFLIVLLAVTREEAELLSEKLRCEVENFPFMHKGRRFQCTVTIGICAYDDQKSMDENFEMADKALYYGKKHGKNCCIWFDDSMKADK